MTRAEGMTRAEAITELNVIYERLSHPEDCENGVYSFRDGDYLEALNMAIDALSDYQRLLNDINDAKEEINYKSDHSDTGMSCGLLSALAIIDKYVYGVKPISTNGKESE